MADEINNGGPAFPVTFPHGPADVLLGMSLRDWFAGRVITGVAAAPFSDEAMDAMASAAYRLADAMISARSR